MLGAFKESVLPVLIYILVWLACVIALVRRGDLATYLYAVLVPLPTLWYPTHFLPLASASLTLLMGSALIGSWLRKIPGETLPSNSGFIWLFVIANYLYLWNTTFRYDLPLPFDSDNPEFAYWRNFSTMVLCYLAAFYALRTQKQIQTLVMVVCAMLLFLAWRELVSFSAGINFSYGHRADGPFWVVGLNANHFGAFIAHFAVLVLGLYLVDRHPLRRNVYLLAFIVSLYPLFLSYSRGAYAATITGLIVLGFLRKRLLLIAVLVLLFAYQELLPASVVDRIQMTETATGTLESSAADRLFVWQLARELFAQHPLIGIGFQGFYFASAGLPLRNVHNFYLETAAEEGIVGLMLLGLLFYKALFSGWQLLRQGDSEPLRALGLGFIACTAAVMVTNIFGDRFTQIELGSYFFLLFGAVDRARQLRTDAASKPSTPAGANPEVRPSTSDGQLVLGREEPLIRAELPWRN